MDKDINKYGVQVKKGQILKALPDENQRYYTQAGQLPAFLDKTFPDVEKLSWKNKEEAQKHKKCIEDNDAEAYFVVSGHAGMIRKGYTDPYYKDYGTGNIWVVFGSCYKEGK